LHFLFVGKSLILPKFHSHVFSYQLWLMQIIRFLRTQRSDFGLENNGSVVFNNKILKTIAAWGHILMVLTIVSTGSKIIHRNKKSNPV